MRAALQDQHTSDVLVTLLSFRRPGETEVIRISSDRTMVVDFDQPNAIWGTKSRGEIYYWLPLMVVFPSYGEDRTPQFRVQIDMIDREIIRILRADNIPADVTVEVVRAVDPDFVCLRHTGYQLMSAPWNDASAQLVVKQRAYDTEPFPAGTMNPSTFPGLFP